ALDIRHVFSEVSDVIRGGLPHHMLALTSWAADGGSFRVYALSGAHIDDPSFWEPTTLPADERAVLHRESYVVRDVETEIPATTVRSRVFHRLGVRSLLRVPMP